MTTEHQAGLMPGVNSGIYVRTGSHAAARWRLDAVGRACVAEAGRRRPAAVSITICAVEEPEK